MSYRTKDSLVLSLAGTSNRLTASAPQGVVTIDISGSYVGQSSITTLGTITTGTWNGSTISNSYLANSSLTVNGTSIALGASGTVTAAAGTLTGTTLNSTVVSSSLTSVGTLGSLVVSGTEHIGGAAFIGATSGTALAQLHIKTGTSGVSSVNVIGGVIESAANGALTVATPNTASGYMMFADPESSIAGVVKYNHANDNMSFFTNATERVIINATGLGIGVTPSSKLDVNGRLTLSGVGTSELYTTDASGLYLTAATNAGMYIASEGSFIFRKATTPFTEYMRLDSSGNLGIGVTPTLGKLHIESSAATNSLYVKGNGIIGTSVVNIVLDDTNGTKPALKIANLTNWAQAGAFVTITAANGSDTGALISLTNAGTGNYLTCDANFTVAKSGLATTSAGINFGGTTLQNYAEGTFTPTITFGGGNTGITYTTQSGNYTRVGRVVTVVMDILLSSKGSSTGGLAITGLPLTVGSLFPMCQIQLYSGFSGAERNAMGYFDSGNTRVSEIYDSANTSITDTQCTNTSRWLISGTYFV